MASYSEATLLLRPASLQVDSKKELEKLLKVTCEVFIMSVTKATVEPHAQLHHQGHSGAGSLQVYQPQHLQCCSASETQAPQRTGGSVKIRLISCHSLSFSQVLPLYRGL